MGCNNTKKKKLNVVFLGSESSGKTSLLYKMRLKNANPIFDPTDSFNYEIIQQKYRDVMFELHAFDLAGKKELQICWPMFYENMPVDVLCVVVHACQREKIDDVMPRLMLTLEKPRCTYQDYQKTMLYGWVKLNHHLFI